MAKKKPASIEVIGVDIAMAKAFLKRGGFAGELDGLADDLAKLLAKRARIAEDACIDAVRGHVRAIRKEIQRNGSVFADITKKAKR